MIAFTKETNGLSIMQLSKLKGEIKWSRKQDRMKEKDKNRVNGQLKWSSINNCAQINTAQLRNLDQIGVAERSNLRNKMEPKLWSLFVIIEYLSLACTSQIGN